MEQMSKVLLIESQRQSREREAAQARREGLNQDLPSRPVAWRVWLIMAILLVGMMIWWIH